MNDDDTSTHANYGCLDGYVVLDLTHYLAGPLCTKILAALGATVIKLEPTEHGDGSRLQPPFVGASGFVYERIDDRLVGLTYLKRNQGKKSVSIDLKVEQGQHILRRLVERTDVVVHNFRAGVAERLGVDEKSLRQIKPNIVYLEINGYGPYAESGKDPGAVDILIQAFSGIMGHSGFPDGPPIRCAAPIADEAAALFATISILAGLIRRDAARGDGQAAQYSVSLLGSLSALFWDEQVDIYAAMGLPHRNGNTTPRIAPFNAYRTSDSKYVAVAAVSEREWGALVTAVGDDRLAKTEWKTLPCRIRDRAAIDTLLSDWVSRKTRDAVCAHLTSFGVPAVPVNTVDDLLSDTRMVSRMLCPVEDPNFGPTPAYEARFPIVENGRQLTQTGRAAPRLGADTRDVLTQMCGFTETEVDHMLASGVVRETPPPPQAAAAPSTAAPDLPSHRSSENG